MNIHIYISDLTTEKQGEIEKAVIAEEKKKLYEEVTPADPLNGPEKYPVAELNEKLKKVYGFDTIREDWKSDEEYQKMLQHDVDMLAEKNAEKRICNLYTEAEI